MAYAEGVFGVMVDHICLPVRRAVEDGVTFSCRDLQYLVADAVARDVVVRDGVALCETDLNIHNGSFA